MPTIPSEESSEKLFVIPPKRTRYLSEIAEQIRAYNEWTEEQAATAGQLQSLQEVQRLFNDCTSEALNTKEKEVRMELDPKIL